MNAIKGRSFLLKTTVTGFVMSLLIPAPLVALELSDMVVDSISMHPEVKEKIHLYRQVLSDRDVAESGWRPSVDLEASTGFYETESPLTTGNQSEDYNSSNVEVSVTQNLFNGYDTTYQIEQTEARTRAALFDVYDTADNIALRAIQAYMEVIKQKTSASTRRFCRRFATAIFPASAAARNCSRPKADSHARRPA
jgi:adhesin transport system outer membrane protein